MRSCKAARKSRRGRFVNLVSKGCRKVSHVRAPSHVGACQAASSSQVRGPLCASRNQIPQGPWSSFTPLRFDNATGTECGTQASVRVEMQLIAGNRTHSGQWACIAAERSYGVEPACQDGAGGFAAYATQGSADLPITGSMHCLPLSDSLALPLQCRWLASRRRRERWACRS